MSCRLVIFDMDGTIVDSMPTLTDLAIKVISENYGVDPDAARLFYEATVGVPFREQLELIFPSKDRNDLVARLYEERHAIAARQFPLMPGIEDLMWDLKCAGIATALVSSTARHVIFEMDQVLRLAFDWVEGFRGMDKRSQILSSCQVMKVQPEEVLYVGDSDFDATCAYDTFAQFARVNGQDTAERVRETLNLRGTNVTETGRDQGLDASR